MLGLVVLVACGPPPAEPAPVERWGQWIWTDADARVYEESRAAVPGLVPTVWVGTVRFAGGGFTTELGHDPRGVAGERAVLVRIDDSAHAAWDARPPAEVARALDERLTRIIGMVRASGLDPVEVQLDYDCPVRRLPAWADALRVLRAGALAGEPVWVTSLVAHLQRPEYGDWMRDVVDGHVLQVFDTGDSALDAREVGALALRAHMPYRMGLGAFERGTADHPTTDHGEWFAALPLACLRPWCEGAWVFPAGQPWVTRLAR